MCAIRVTVITWHPDVYRYGKDEHRLALLESLRTGGCEVRFAQDNCQHFAIIDETVLWYGSMNLLSRDDVEDNIMRLESREVAEELLGITAANACGGMTFNGEADDENG